MCKILNPSIITYVLHNETISELCQIIIYRKVEIGNVSNSLLRNNILDQDTYTVAIKRPVGFHRLKIILDWRAASTIISDYWCVGKTEDRRPRYNRTREVYRAYHPTWKLVYHNSIRVWGSRTPNGCQSRRLSVFTIW